MNKSERELFEEEMAKWIEETERRADERRKKSKKLHEGLTPQFNSIEEADKYYNAIPWDEVYQRLLNNADK
ncbi:MAG TPA: hypothetical protein DCZ30_04525 [Clostridiales bacterium]|nr:hypothetical protein [Clostridiales bacterium]